MPALSQPDGGMGHAAEPPDAASKLKFSIQTRKTMQECTHSDMLLAGWFIQE